MTATPTPAGDRTEPEDRRASPVEAQVLAMRSQAMAIAQTASAFAVQCDSMLVALGILGGLGGSRPAAGARPAPSQPAVTHPTFGRKDAKTDVEALTERIATTDPTRSE